MIEPLPWATIFGAAARQVSNVVPRCASSRSWNCALVTVRIDSLANPAVPAQLTRMSIWPNSFMLVSISASASAGSAGEPGNATAPAMPRAASATDKPTPRVPPTTTAPRPASGSLIARVRLGELHGVHVPVAAQVRKQAGLVDLVCEDPADRADHPVR